MILNHMQHAHSVMPIKQTTRETVHEVNKTDSFSVIGKFLFSVQYLSMIIEVCPVGSLIFLPQIHPYQLTGCNRGNRLTGHCNIKFKYLNILSVW